MKKIRLANIMIVVSMGVVGCVSGKVNYIPPTGVQEKNSIILQQSMDEVWTKMIDGIGDSFFVINNIEKDSGLINVSYTGDPCRYIDCGIVDSNVSNARGKRNYYFSACEKYKDYEEFQNGQLFFVKRSMQLEGRANIIIRVISGGTLVKVNVRYIVNKKAKIYDPLWRFLGDRNDSISFNSNGGDTFPGSTTKCFANGNFEREILNLVTD